jgi:hypothetical protein
VLKKLLRFAAMDEDAPGFAKRLFQRLRDFFRAIANYFRGRGFDKPESTFDKVDKGEFSERLRARKSPVDSSEQLLNARMFQASYGLRRSGN